MISTNDHNGQQILAWIWLFICCFLISSSGMAQSKLLGTYRSNFAQLGFFVSRLELKADSTFEYSWRGDLMSDNGRGCYEVVKDTVFLSYFPDKNNTFVDETGHVWQDLEVNHHRPDRLLYRRGRIWNLTPNNRRNTKKVVGYFHRKRYWLFGANYYPKKTFLIRLQQKKAK